MPTDITALQAKMTAFEQRYLVVMLIIAAMSLISLVVSILVFVFNRKHNKSILSLQIKTSIDAAKSEISSLALQIIPLRSKSKPIAEEKRQLDELQKLNDAAFEKLLNCYEDACQRYLNKQLDSNEFRKRYFHDVREYIDQFPDQFTEPATRFYSMLQVYRQWHRPK